MKAVGATKTRRGDGAPCARLLVLALSFCPVALADPAVAEGQALLPTGEDAPSASRMAATPGSSAREVAREGRGRHHGRLMHLVGFQLESLSALRETTLPGNQLVDHVAFEQMNREARRGAERVAEKAVKEYLLELTDLDRLLDAIRSSGGDPAAARGEPRSRWDVNVGFYRTLPRVEMRYPLSRGTLRFGLAAAGNVDFEYRGSDQGDTRFGVGYDLEGRYRLYTRLGF